LRDIWTRICWRWLPFIGWMGLIYWLSAQPHLPHPARRLGLSDYLFDYGAHAGTFGFLAMLTWRAFLPDEPRLASARSAAQQERRTLCAAALWALIYAFSDEIHQRFVPGRWSSWLDCLADLAGILIAMILLATWVRYRAAILDWWHAIRARRSLGIGPRGRWSEDPKSSSSAGDRG
jgi:VanZ family protein